MHAVRILFAVALLALLSACGETAPTIAPPPDPLEKLIWSSAAERPAWTMEEPDTKDGQMWFVGLSGKFATEQLARDDAKRNATKSVVQYMGTLVKDKFEKARVSYGLESDVVDPTAAAREFEKQMAVNMANKVKVKNWYQEKWQTPTGVGHVAFALSFVPLEAIDETVKETAQGQAKNAERKAKEANDDFAKKQAEKAAEFWKQMEDQGVAEKDK
ncbi:MAG: hypothetical protein A2091_03285 [Desulfuromonadales bacterium GWD2_61_12]|nr:MAG: hypothetical protein A2005_06395 [Desulfuromonadales bacterium GWC2_61_20]OGR34926.1 MAG: hypothetical protein A2091_03285 [Desulfuromonadales bacterium GWD2_61_12]HAD04416.1 hypothetical protein [Desulfuromonas sp.]